MRVIPKVGSPYCVTLLLVLPILDPNTISKYVWKGLSLEVYLSVALLKK